MPTLCLTRSEPSNGELAGSLQNSGWQIQRQPVVTTEPSDVWKEQLADLQTPNLVILTSGHGAREYLATELSERARTVLHLAQGPATAEVLRAEGFTLAVPDQHDAEGLLAHPSVNGLGEGSIVWVISGEGGREVLQPALAERGLDAVKLAVYRRVSLKFVRPANADLIEISSQAALKTIAKHSEPKTLNVLVVSQRLADLARDAGFRSIHQAKGADGDSILACLRTLNE